MNGMPMNGVGGGPNCAIPNIPISNCTPMPSSTSSPSLDLQALASSIFAVVKPQHFQQQPPHPPKKGQSKPRPTGRRLHHLLESGPYIWEFPTYERLRDYLLPVPPSPPTEDTLFALLTRSRLVVGARACHKCGRSMQLRSRLSNQRNQPSVEWRCRVSRNGRKVDCSTQSFRNGSVFASSKVDLHKHVESLFGFLVDMDWDSIVDQKGELRTALSRSISSQRQVGTAGALIDVSVLTFGDPVPHQCVIFTERSQPGKCAGRMAAAVVSPSSDTIYSIGRWVAPGAKLCFNDQDTTLKNIVRTQSNLYQIATPEESEATMQSTVMPEARQMMMTIASMRKALDDTVIAECMLRFNYSFDLPRVFWNLFAVQDTDVAVAALPVPTSSSVAPPPSTSLPVSLPFSPATIASAAFVCSTQN